MSTTLDVPLTDHSLIEHLDFDPDLPEPCEFGIQAPCDKEAHWMISLTCSYHPHVRACDFHKRHVEEQVRQHNLRPSVLTCGFDSRCMWDPIRVVGIEPIK